MNTVDVVYEGAHGPWTVARVAQQGTATFVEYTDEHRERGIDLAPITHPVDQPTRLFDVGIATALPGLLADAMPDSWGQLVLRRELRSHGVERPTPLQLLSWLGRRTMGALTFTPVTGPPDLDVALVDLDRVQAAMLRRLADLDAIDEDADHLTRVAGSSAGGARPKITAAFTRDGHLVADTGRVPDGAVPWLVKFHTDSDPADLSAIEATYLQMAAAAGLTTCDHQLLPGPSGTSYLAVRRFDRAATTDGQPRRIHMATAAGLLEAYPERGALMGYDSLVRLTRRVTGDARDVHEVVRRAVFNVIAHNRDDHARNIAYLCTEHGGWRLAPAYDLTYALGPRPAHLANEPGEHYLDIAGKGARITRQDLHQLAAGAQLRTTDIDAMVDQTLTAVERWSELALTNGVSATSIATIGQRLPALGR